MVITAIHFLWVTWLNYGQVMLRRSTPTPPPRRVKSRHQLQSQFKSRCRESWPLYLIFRGTVDQHVSCRDVTDSWRLFNKTDSFVRFLSQFSFYFHLIFNVKNTFSISTEVILCFQTVIFRFSTSINTLNKSSGNFQISTEFFPYISASSWI